MTMMTRATAVEAPAWLIRPEQAIDLDQIHDLHRTVFGRPAEAELVDAIRSGPDFIPELSLVAVADEGSVLGHVLVSRVGFEPDSGGPRIDVLSLAPLAVLPPHAGRGIGTALTMAALEAADAGDEPFVAVLGPPAFFRRVGFVPADEHGIYSRYDHAGRAFQVRPRRSDGVEVPAGMVVYPSMFEVV
jgi:putative acetyltransferase